MKFFKKGTITLSKIFIFTAAFVILVASIYFVSFKLHDSPSKKGGLPPIPADIALANYRYTPTGGTIITGTAQTITSQTAAASEGTNVGSWKGTHAFDSFHWQIASTASGINVEETLGGAALNGANSIFIETVFDLDTTVPQTLVQVCDFVSTASVDNTASGGCTGGGWRTLNNRKVTIAATTTTGYSWHIYDGYWTNGSNTAISTPLSNFLSSNQILIRYYSTTNTTSVLSIDFVRAFVVVHPLYTASSLVNLGTGTVTGEYINTTVVAQGASDNTYMQVAGTAGSIADFYNTFSNIKTYSGMNTIMLKSEYSCTAATAGLNIRPKIYNFSSSSWENMSSAAFACSTTDATGYFAKSGVTISNYVSSGIVRIGWYGSANSTTAIRLDYEYIILGTTNSDTAVCQVTFGTVSSGTCANTATMDTSGADSSWIITAEDESTAVAHDFYPGDTDGDATVEEAVGAHVKFSNIIRPNNGYITGVIPIARYIPTSATGATVTVAMRDYGTTAINTSVNSSLRSGFVTASSSAATTATVNDTTYLTGQASAAINVGTQGLFGAPAGYLQTMSNQMWMAFQTSTDGATTLNASTSIDFAMVALVWTEDSSSLSESYIFSPTGENIITGTQPSNSAATAAAVEGVETGGGWQALLADDNFHMGIISTTSGYNAEVTLGNAQLNGANQMLLQTEVDEDATAPSTLWQICDFVSTTSVDSAASGGCSGGGWRTINNRKLAIAPTTSIQYNASLFDGYWSNGSGTAISTPLSNFISSSNNILVRYYSTTNTTTTVNIDFVRAALWVSPLYYPGGFTNLGSGSPTNDYTLTNTVTLGASDNNYLQVPGTASSIANFYLSFKNIKTFTGMNTIVFRAEYACTAATAGLNIRPKIYNFSSSSWENLGANAIACSVTDATTEYAKNNTTLSDYISGGEMRIGWYGSANSTTGIKIDMEYIMLGATNTASTSSDCFIDFGTLSANDCTATRDLVDMGAGTDTTWKIAAEDESTTFSHDYYPFDIDNDAVASEEGSAALAAFSITKNTNTTPLSFFYAGRYKAGTGGTMLMSVLDNSGYFGAPAILGGFWNLSIGATTSFIYSDNVTLASLLGYQGQLYGMDDILDTVNNRVFMRYRTSVDGASTTNSIPEWDFAMATMSWIEVAPKYTISGNIYQSGSQSTLDTTAYTVAVSVNNGTPYTATASAGTYSVPNVPLTAGDTIAVYIQGNANDANSISEVSAADQTVNLYVGRTAIYHTYTDSTSNTEVCSQSTYPASGDNLFTCATSVPTYSSGGLLVAGAYAPGGNVNATVAEIMSGGTYTGGSEILTVTNSGTGTSRPFIQVGAFTPSTNTVVFTGTSATEITATTYNNLQIYPASGTQTYTLGTAVSQAVVVNGNLQIGNGGTTTFDFDTYDPTLTVKGGITLSSLAVWTKSQSATLTLSPVGTQTITDNNSTKSDLGPVAVTGGTSTPKINMGSSLKMSTLTIAASHEFSANGSNTLTLIETSGTLLTNSGTFTASTGTVEYTPNASVTLTSGTLTFNNLTLDPTITSTGKTYTFGSSALVVNGDFTINPTASSSLALTVNLGAATTVAGTTSVTGTTSGTSNLSTTGTNYALTSGLINIGSAGTFTANGSTVTLTGASGTLFTNNGTVNYGTSTVIMNTDASVTLTSGTVSFYNLSLTPVITASRTYTFGAGVLDMYGDFIINPTASSAIALVVVLGNTTTVAQAKTTTITGTTLGNGDLQTGGVSFSTGRLVIGSLGIFEPASSTVSLTGLISPLFSNSGIFTYGTSTISFTADSSYYIGTPLTSGVSDYYNLDMSPTIGGDAYYYLSALTSVSVHNNFTISPNAASAYTLAVSTGVPMTVSGTTDVAASGSAMSLLTTTSSNYTFTTTSLRIHSGATFNANASTVEIIGTGTPVLNSGTHNSSSGLYHYNGDDNVLIDDTPYFELWLEPVQTTDRTYDVVNPSSNLVVTHLFSISPRGSGGRTLIFMHDGDISGGGDIHINEWATGDLAQLKPPTPHSYTLGTLHVYDKGLADLTPLSALSVGGVIIDDSPDAQLTAPNTITMYDSGDFYLYDRGVFLNSNGVIDFNGTGAQVVYGVNNNLDSNPFYNLVVSNPSGQVSFTNYTTMTVQNLFTIPSVNVQIAFQDGSVFQVQDIDWQGANSTYARLTSTNPGSPWQLKQSGAQYNVRYVSATDSDASLGNVINATDPTNHDGGNNNNWNFGSASLTMSLSSNAVTFGTLSSSGPRFADTTSGSSSEVEAHTFSVSTTAVSGYAVTVGGSTLSNGAHAISAIGASNTTSSSGIEQFGLRVEISSTTGGATVPGTYGTSSNYAFDGGNANTIATSSIADTSTYSVRYIGNISPVTQNGSYSTSLTYIATGEF